MILAPLRWLGRHGTRLVAASIFIGLLFPGLAEIARPAFPVAVFSMLTIAMIRVDLPTAKAYVTRPGLIIVSTLWLMVLTPVVLAGVASLFDPTPAIILALVFWASAPSTVSSPAFSNLLGLNGTLSLSMLLIAMMSAPFVVPGMTELLTNAEIEVTTFGLMVRLALLIGGSAITATVIRMLMSEERRTEAEPVFDGLNVVFMALFAVAAMDGVTAAFIDRPWHVIGLIALTAALSVGCLLVATAVFWSRGRSTAATIGFSNGNRNMALVLGALAGNVPEDTWIFFAVAQFPIYLMPLMLAPMYRRLTGQPDGYRSV